MGVSKIAVVAGFAVALGSGAASADNSFGHLSGTLSAGYDRYDADGASANQFNAKGSAVFTLENPGADIQVNFDNTGIKENGKDTDNWSFGGDAYWRDYAGEFGINLTQNTLDATTTGHDYRSGGFFGEFYAFPDLTLRAKGGKVQGDLDGWYGDTGLVFYPMDQVAISLTGDYARFQHAGPQITDGVVSIEYLPVREIPISLSLSYTYARYQHTTTAAFEGDTNIFSIALKAYFGGGGRNGGLVDYQRNGPTDWDGAQTTIIGASH